MPMNQPATTTNINNVESSLTNFYNLANRLTKIRFVRFLGKEDDADTIIWSFTYRKRRFTLQYSIYNGISLLSEDADDEKLITKLAKKLKFINS